ncbi:MAG: hypothetical protein H0X64_09200 [Gemmatimonadaceae bacterium]|nr:hypothetical protein [Gemmatimonadaceae bacterium]
MRTSSRFICAIPLIAVAILGGCATAAPSGDAITRLQVRRDAQPRAAAVHRSLGIALYKADRIPEARAALSEAMRLDSRDGATALYLGLAAEKQGDLAAAREAYVSYLRHGRTRGVRSQLQARLATLQRRELEQAAKTAVASEATIGTSAGHPRVVAVMPFRFTGSDSSLRPLERGMAELVTTDLARSSALTVVERARMQALLNELALQQGSGDPATAVRAGRMLQAGRLVQGGILLVGAEQLRVDAAIVDVPTSAAVGGAAGDDRLGALFDLEKRLVLDLFTSLGVTLTAAERRAFDQRPTRSLAAFLSFSQGLMAEDAGDFDAARRFFDNAFRIDPGFGAAAQRAATAADIVAGEQVTTETVEAQAATGTEGQVAAAAVQGTVLATASSAEMASTLSSVVNDVNTTQSGTAAAGTTTVGGGNPNPSAPGRDPVSEGSGNDSPTTRAAKVVIVIGIPGTTPTILPAGRP